MRPADFISVTEMALPPEQLFITRADSPFGPVLLAADTFGLTHIWMNGDGQAVARMQDVLPKTKLIEQASPHHMAALSCFGPRPQPLALHLKGTPFQLSVWRALLNIPFGATSTYKTIATQIGKPKATRAVGSAIGRNPAFFVIPCHRVLAHGGGLGGYFWGTEVKTKLLEWEQANTLA